jgi:hypothetical protein
MFCMLNRKSVLNVEVGSHVFIRNYLIQGPKSLEFKETSNEHINTYLSIQQKIRFYTQNIRVI